MCYLSGHISPEYGHVLPKYGRVPLVVAGEGDHAAECDADGVEVLCGRVDPDRGLTQQLPLGFDEELDAEVCARQRAAPGDQGNDH